MNLHRSSRADFNAEFAGDTFIVVEMDFTGNGINC